MSERIDKNGQIFATNFAELGVPVIFIKGIESPLGDTYYFDMVNVSQYSKRYLETLLTKMSVYHRT